MQTCAGLIMSAMLSGGSAGGDCGSCHRFPATRSHLVGVRPAFDLPVEYPLDSRGRVTCFTCHEASAGAASKAGWSLRGAARGSTFCRSCHRVRPDDGSRIAHAIRGGTAHGDSSRATQRDRFRFAARASLQCLGCHDGVIAEGGHLTARPGLVRRGLDSGHPTGVDYAAAERSSPTLRPAMLLTAALRLENGAVGCTSCHDAFSSLPAQLVIDNSHSALCTSCHRT